MTPQRRQRARTRTAAPAAAIGTVFFVNGATYSSWSPRLPELQAALGISDAALGVTLVGGGVGGLAASAFSGWLVDRRGSRAVTTSTSLALSLALPLIAFAPIAGLMFMALVAVGALDGLTDVAMNSQALDLQATLGRSIMTRFHAMWSLGTIAGGLAAAAAATAGVSLTTHLTTVGAGLALTTVVASRWLLPGRHLDPVPVASAHNDVTRQGPARPASGRRTIVGLFLVGTAIAMVEMPPGDWSALLLTDRFAVSPGTAARGFVAVAAGMFAGRLVGDHVADRFGADRTRRAGALVAAIGVVVAAAAPAAWLAVAGLGATGMGVATLFPLTFQAAGERVRSAHAGMAAFSSGVRAGALVAPVLVGFLAEHSSVAVALVVVSGGAGLVVGAVRLPAGGDQPEHDTPLVVS